MGETTRKILRRQEDWESWFWQLKSDVQSQIWPYIDPNGPDRPLQPEPTAPSYQEYNQEATTYGGLTSAQQRAYDNARKYYEADLKIYSLQQTQLTAARTLIRSTVSSGNQNFLDPNLSVKEWLKELQKGFKPEEGYMRTMIRQKYRDIITQKGGKLSQWLDKWEEVMAEGIRYDIPETKDGIWLIDLSERVQPLSEYQSSTLKAESRDEKLRDAAHFREKSRRLREDIRWNQGRAQRGNAYEAMFHQESDPGSETPQGQGSGRRQHGQDGNPSKRPKITCKGCGGAHKLAECWTIFDHLRPADAHPPSQYRKKKVEQALKDDPDLQKEVDKLKQEMKDL
ncbi:hypothetical protein DV736_g456, partial [Chaetothyriales sp. CBS 134916]